MRQVTKNIYTFDELPDKAKEKAREWYRSGLDNTDFDGTVEDIKTVAGYLGYVNPELYWSVGYCQSDMATVCAVWQASKVQADEVIEHAPIDKALHAITLAFAGLAVTDPEATFKTSERWAVDRLDCAGHFDDAYTAASEAVKAFNRWAYKQLREQDEFLTSDENVDEQMLNNKYEFTETGERYAQG